MIRAVSVLAFVLASLGAASSAMADATPAPARADRLTHGIQRYIDSGRIAGAITVVHRGGEEVHADILGFQDREAGTPMKRDTIFRIYSMSKPITSVATLILVEEGTIRLSDPITKWLPEFADGKVLKRPDAELDDVTDAERAITVHDLLTHTSGLAYDFTAVGPLAKALKEQGVDGSGTRITPDEFAARLGALPLMYPPGDRWHYSLADDVLGVLIARASGMPFAEFLERRLFAPLGMKDTAFWVPPEKLDRLAVNYSIHPETGETVVFDHPSQTRYAEPATFASGGGGLVSTTDDYLRFARMLLGMGELDGVRILGRKTVELMTTNALRPEQRRIEIGPLASYFDGQGYGLGVRVVDDIGMARSLGSPGTHGWGGAAGTWYLVDPEEDLVALMMIQLMGGGQTTPIRGDFETLVYQGIAD